MPLPLPLCLDIGQPVSKLIGPLNYRTTPPPNLPHYVTDHLSVLEQALGVKENVFRVQ